MKKLVMYSVETRAPLAVQRCSPRLAERLSAELGRRVEAFFDVADQTWKLALALELLRENGAEIQTVYAVEVEVDPEVGS